MDKKRRIGMMISEIGTPNIVRIMKSSGFDFVIIDGEHGYFNYETIAAMISLAKAIDLTIIVRVPSLSKEYIAKVMDMGADGILLPMTNTKNEAETLVKYIKYPPIGLRGVSTQRAHTNYNPKDLKTTMRETNKKTLVFAQVETQESIKNLEEIVALDYLTGIFIGPNDLSVDYGDPGNYENEEFKKGMDTILSIAQHYNKPVGMINGNIPFLKKYEQKLSWISCNSEVGMLISMGKSIVNELKGENKQ